MTPPDAVCLPATALAIICDRIARDPEPLLSLSSRVMTLLALRRVDTEARDAVSHHGIRMLSGKDEREVIAPSAEVLARASDVEIRRLEHYYSTWERGRSTAARPLAVERLLALGDGDGALLKLCWLRKALRSRESHTITASSARVKYRLSKEDLEALGPSPYLVDFVLDAAIRRHGSSARMAARDAGIMLSSERRAATIAMRSSRRIGLWAGEFFEGVAEEDLTLLRGSLSSSPSSSLPDEKEEEATAIERYARSGADADLASARALLDAALAAMKARRLELSTEAQPWPAHELRLVPPEVTRAYTNYVLKGGQDDKEAVLGCSARWSEVLELWKDAPLLDDGSRWPWPRLGADHKALCTSSRRWLGDPTTGREWAWADIELARSRWQEVAGPLVGACVVGMTRSRRAFVLNSAWEQCKRFASIATPPPNELQELFRPSIASVLTLASSRYVDVMWVTTVRNGLIPLIGGQLALAPETWRIAAATIGGVFDRYEEPLPDGPELVGIVKAAWDAAISASATIASASASSPGSCSGCQANHRSRYCHNHRCKTCCRKHENDGGRHCCYHDRIRVHN